MLASQPPQIYSPPKNQRNIQNKLCFSKNQLCVQCFGSSIAFGQKQKCLFYECSLQKMFFCNNKTQFATQNLYNDKWKLNGVSHGKNNGFHFIELWISGGIWSCQLHIRLKCPPSQKTTEICKKCVVIVKHVSSNSNYWSTFKK